MGTDRSVAAVVLAAGEGKRLRSRLPKVLHEVAGKPLLVHALHALDALTPDQIVVVASARKDDIVEKVSAHGIEADYAIQDPPLGTGDAVKRALEVLAPSDEIVVVNGDCPTLGGETLVAMMQAHRASEAAVTVLTTDAPGPSDSGRVIRNDNDEIERVIEVRDAAPGHLRITEVNAGAYVFDGDVILALLDGLSPDNAQNEYYLTDVIALARSRDLVVLPFKAAWEETIGVNDRAQLAEAGRVLYRRTADRWLLEGVSILDPATTFIDTTVEIEADATILPFTFLHGATRIASGAEVGPQCRVFDSTIGSGATVSYSVVRGSTIGADASVGPFASLRPGTVLADGAKLGTFVESKNASLGPRSKANHLSYLGDAEIGADVNIGAGTITCNWDGKNKHTTVIEDEAYISSDTMLVAPVTIGKRAATGAGAVVTEDVPEDALAVGVPARMIEGKGRRLDKELDEEPRKEPDEG